MLIFGPLRATERAVCAEIGFELVATSIPGSKRHLTYCEGNAQGIGAARAVSRVGCVN